MDANLKKVTTAKIKRTLKALQANGYNACYAETKEEALKLVKLLVPQKSLTASGSSITLSECGILDYLKNETDYIDRFEKGISDEERKERMRKTFFSAYYLSGANAITEHGEVYNVDNTGNRIAAIAYGPDNVIFVASLNKVVPTLSDAVERVKRISAPANTQRLGAETFCVKNGVCIEPFMDERHLMCKADCGEKTLCRKTLILSRVQKERYTIILVGEDVGY
ncbi:MAG: lactate utilization protein [Sphaerochaetaceae bacterium]|nr:lactate utilization protein [Sphaerochaetaceae bacterium]